MDEKRGVQLSFGLMFIAAGLLFLAISTGLIGHLYSWWPLFVMVPGLFLLLLSFSSRSARGAVFPGTIVTLVGLLFLAWFNHWFSIDMTRFWPVFPCIVGFAFVMLYIFEPGASGVLVPAFILLTISVVFFGINYGKLGRGILAYWPVLLVVIGLASIVRSLTCRPAGGSRSDSNVKEE